MIFPIFYSLKYLIQKLSLAPVLNVGSIFSASTCICASDSALREGKSSKPFNYELPLDIAVTSSALGIDYSRESSIAWNESFQQFFLKDHLWITISLQMSSAVLTNLVTMIRWALCTSCCGTVIFVNGFIGNITVNWGKQKLCGNFNSTS